MNNVSPELKQLFRAGELASRPLDVDRERVLRQLESRLGITLCNSGDVGNVAVPKNPGRSLITRIVGISAAALVVATGGIALMNSVTPKRPPEVENTTSKLAIGAGLSSATVEAPTTTLQQHSAQLEDVRAPAADLPKAARSAVALRATSHSRDNLSEEVTILSRAQNELLRGRAESALRLLGEHERKFSRGILAEERTAAKIQALCALGRVSEANALLSRVSPRSVTGESARQACASSKQAASTR